MEDGKSKKKYKVVYKDETTIEVVEMFDSMEEADTYIMGELERMAEEGMTNVGYDLFEVDESRMN